MPDVQAVLAQWVRGDIIKVAFAGGAGGTWLVMLWVTANVPDRWWNPIAAVTGIVTTLLLGLSSRTILNGSDLAGAIVAGAVAGVVTLNVGHRSSTRVVTDAANRGALRPDALEPAARKKLQDPGDPHV